MARAPDVSATDLKTEDGTDGDDATNHEEERAMTGSQIKKRETETPTKVERAEGFPTFVPRVDICENDQTVVLTADMPGVDEKTINIDLDRNTLTIRGDFAPRAPEGYSLTYEEYRSGNYERMFTLGNEIDRDGIKATVRDGVLRLELPKSKAVQPKRITVQAG